ncbi:sporulation protein [Aliamphritea hakodatensis]|uniref:sporulation protein n=1 Tax=Aliamphritea hakodatensis TaxID=2895352 RepID=UPI0022FD8DF6|nr:sporulation protein [Aliamphritea hakodatensis]
MLKNLFARIGVGAATVDTILTTEHFLPGARVEGRIDVKGGDVEQEISAITLKLMTNAKVESDDTVSYVAHPINQFQVTEAFTLKPNESRSMDFSFDLHPETPITVLETHNNQCRVWVETALDIDFAVDPTDRDPMHIHPPQAVTYFIQAMNACGYAMVKADVESGFLRANTFRSHSGCYQEIEFRPGGYGSLFGSIQEAELSFILTPDTTHVLIELDRTFAGDGYREISVSNHASYAQIEAQIKSLLG